MMARESLCWSCSHAYAKSDAEGGCGFHRKEHERVWDGASTKNMKTMGKVSTGMPAGITFLVEKCAHYKLSDRAVRDRHNKLLQQQELARNARDTVVERWKRTGIVCYPNQIYGPETYAKIVELFGKMKYSDIAKEAGCSKGTVSKVLKEAGILAITGDRRKLGRGKLEYGAK